MFTTNDIEDTAFFYYTIQSIHHLKEISIADLEELDISILQRISKAANYDGIMLLLAVDSHGRNLIVDTYIPDRQSKPLPPFTESPDSAIYISNSIDPYTVHKKLQEISERYNLLNAPPFQKYEHDDETENCNWTVPFEDFLRENAKAKFLHEVFMRDYGMHQTIIPSNYKKRAIRMQLIKKD